MADECISPAPWLFVIIGTTGSGKTKLSVELAEALQRNVGMKSEVVSADSMQLYKAIDILSAKATIEEQARVKHHLLDILNLEDYDFSVASYQRMAKALVSELLASESCPILVGGTNYYIESVLWEDKFMFELDVSSISTEIRAEIDLLSDKALHDRLCAVDPDRAELLHPNARRKVMRSLEIFYATKKPHSTWIKEQKDKARFAFPKICMFWVSCDTAALDQRLDRRVDEMVTNGLKNELKAIAEKFRGAIKPIDWSRGAFQSIGLREFQPWLEAYQTTGTDNLDLFASALLDVKTHSRQYTRSQISWIKNGILPHSIVYRLDSTDPSLWSNRVLQPALAIASFLLRGGAKPDVLSIPDSSVSTAVILTPSPDQPLETPWKKHFCEFCSRTLNGETEWQAHVRSKGHKAFRRKFFKPSNLSTATQTTASDTASSSAPHIS